MSGIEILNNIINNILNPAVRVLFAAGFFLFLWGLFNFLYNLESVAKEKGDHNKRQEGARHLKWGIVGMLIMVSVQGILALIINTFGINPQDIGTPASGAGQGSQNTPLPFFDKK